MNWIDVVVLLVWVVMAAWGFSAGFFGIVIPLVAVIAGLAISSRIAEDVGNMFSGLTDNEGAQAIGGFVLIFVGLFIVAAAANFLISAFLRYLPPVGLVNRVAGVAAGIVIGFLLLSGLLTGVQKYTDRVGESIDQSALGVFLADNFDVVIRGARLIPGDWDNEVEDFAN